MPRVCSICRHPEREAIEKALVGNDAGYRSIAKRFAISESALFRHRQKHLPEVLARGLAAVPTPVHGTVGEGSEPDSHAKRIANHHQALEDQQDRHAIDVMQQLKAINAACLEVLRQARADGKHSILLRAVDRIARQIELQAKLLGQIQDTQTVNIAILPEWHGIRQMVLEALQPYPEARIAVARALKGAES
ncbi:MAG: hypothetical protein K0U98_21440 [Deltaproteobacteria bacterium]|nr:hypothetical protein [Deltaproteobacteria bacterium]